MFCLLADAQSSLQVGGGSETTEHIVTFELIPINNIPCNTIIMQVPVTQDYFNSVYVNQEITSWFKTHNNVLLLGSIPTNSWKVVIRNKQTWTQHSQFTLYK
jgi:hypothetical protein